MPEPIQSVLVTGASSGIGKAIVTRLLEQGLQVTGLSRRAPDLQHPNFTWRECDLNDFAALDKALQQTPHIDALIHAAGFMRTAPLGELNAADGQAMWHLHVAAASHMVNALYPRLRAGSRILMIGSRTMQGAAGRSQYAASKAALQGMVRSWAIELAPRGITVNLIAPGATETPMLLAPGRSGTPPRKPPIGRFVQPDEIAGLAAFLLGPDAGAITGQSLVVCGGASL
ncbi:MULTISPECIES: SDR family NAD(P)-dependent oxidoreductase [Pseudomonas syringae group genomosp. 2]|uniref:SDR family NAD(P)-dependent oxidoreductase n=1 Tax=Pseudomonas syringae group genomosp. 2 TaxID=251698 RepID=UPI0001CC1BE9|nr:MULTISPECIES: SDR family oxidoreductase [Pseudomonas syringae group genomosp. 2]EGH01095.1 short chain dehydrogenase/reductase family oxidoreductase [Pseudomonas amygdali pv. aesculi str. 0893_23]KWT15860.1 oxidoreductase [Pseudomonas amygdali pv. aesculi]KWT17050.1 oxidoreductase [Pseudomonas amygdali pv. aesculi]KWT17916.1 oxidoreductase [Pseudomonas amygdali pv. aesculi]KWT20539.1 oxidoreductase [Pseudomonas amygdali pv. aesculi]